MTKVIQNTVPNNNWLEIPVSIVKGINPKIIAKITLREIIQELKRTDQKAVDFATKLRILHDQDEPGYKKEKEKNCPGFIVGEFSYRNGDGLKSFVPLMVFDIDHIPEVTPLSIIIGDLRNLPYVFLAYPSPSGKGLRVMIKTDTGLSNFKDNYKILCSYLSESLKIPLKANDQGKGFIDTGTNNVDRCWFYVPVDHSEIYLNTNSQVYTFPVVLEPTKAPELHEPQRDKTKNNQVNKHLSKADQYEFFKDRIESKEGKIMPGNRGGKPVFLLACELAKHSFSSIEAENYLTEFVDDVFTRNELKKQVNSAFKTAKVEFTESQAINYILKSQGEKAPTTKQFRIIEPKENLIELDYNKEIELDKSLIQRDCQYFWKSEKNGRTIEFPISNFIINPLYLLENNKQQRRVFELININGEKTEICISVKDMVKIDLLQGVIFGKGNFVPEWTKPQVNRVFTCVFPKEQKAEEIITLGYQSKTGYYVFSNGIFTGSDFYNLNDRGFVTINNKTYFIPANSNIFEEETSSYENEKRFKYAPSETDFATWSDQFIKAYETKNGRIGICFVIASFFRDIVFRTNNSSFPLLFLFGISKSGKSSFRESIQKIWGEPQSAISLESATSSKGFARSLAQFSNAAICFEEYKNSLDKHLIGMLKNIYDGIGYTRAQTSNDNKTHSTPVLCSAIVGGEDMPIKQNSVFNRVVLLEFTEKLRITETQRQDFEQLRSIEEKGLGNIALQILSYRSLIEQNYKMSYQSVYEELRERIRENYISDRQIKNMAAIITPAKILIPHLGCNFTYQSLIATCLDMVKGHGILLKYTNNVSQFWEAFRYLSEAGTIRDTEYKKGTDDYGRDVLYLDYNSVYPKIFEYSQRQKLGEIDKVTLLEYLKKSPMFIKPQQNNGENRDTIKKRLSDGKTSNCYMFDFKMIDEY